MPAFYDYATAREAGAAWDRPHFEYFTWGWIEPQPGVFDSQATDRQVRDAQEFDFHILANIQPRANWDLAKCRAIAYSPSAPPAPFNDAYKPCDMERFRDFVSRLVERYDGDGLDDMPGLTAPIKHWEIMNEPEFDFYFLGTPADYFEILKATAEAAKAADPEAMIVQGGMAGMMPECTEFWQAVFDRGGAQYIDIFNMHSIGHGEHLNIPAFKAFLAKNGISGKPIWVTEVQYQQSHQTEYSSPEQFAQIMARSYIFALAHGVDKLFYVNLVKAHFAPGAPFDERSALLDDSLQKTPMFYTHRTIADMLGDLNADDTVQVLAEKIGSWSIETGQYKFVIDGRTIYALWGSGPLPAEITGAVKITGMTGETRTADAATIMLTSTPIFVEPL